MDELSLGLLILAGGLYFFAHISHIFTSDEELTDREDRQRYQLGNRRLQARHRRLNDYAWEEGAEAADAGYGGGGGGYFPAQERLNQYNGRRRRARGRAREHWNSAREFAHVVPVLPGGSIYEDAAARGLRRENY